MRKAITIFAFIAILCSCVNNQQGNNTTTDSVAVASVYDDEEKPEVPNSIFAHVADSIYKAHPGDIKNTIIREDIAKDLKKYALQFKGKHMPMIEELPFKLTHVVQEGNKYIACFQYEKDANEKNLGLELQLAVPQSRDEAAKLYEGKYYTIKGIMAGFPYARVMPYVLEPDNLYRVEMPLMSFGAIKINNAELTIK